jgi:hypothetical protein
MEQQKEVWDEKPWYAKWGHTILDVLGLIPLVGEPADAVNAAWYAAEDDWVDAGLSAAALIPFAGAAFTGGKLLGRAGRLADLLRMVDRFGNVIDPASPLAKSLLKGMKVEDGVYTFPNAADLSAALRAKHANMEFRSRELAFLTDDAGNVEQLKVFVNGTWVPVDSSKLGLRLSELKAGDSPWDLLGLPRGEVIESALARSEYAGYTHIGKERQGFYPTIDFLNDHGHAVSLKTMDPPNATSVGKILTNIDALANLNSAGKTVDGRLVTSAELDLRIRIGQENSPEVLRLLKYAKRMKVHVDVNTY